MISTDLSPHYPISQPAKLSPKGRQNSPIYSFKNIVCFAKNVPNDPISLLIRLVSLRNAPQMETWEALTNLPYSELLREKEKGVLPFKHFLSQRGVWIPCIEDMHEKVAQNILAKVQDFLENPLSAKLKRRIFAISVRAQILSLSSEPRKKPVYIVRGPPGAGKSTYLHTRNQFSISSDLIKILLLSKIRGLNPQQLHIQSTAILERICRVVEEQFQQTITTEGQFTITETILNKIIAARKFKQPVHIVDIHIDFITICCRILQRSTFEPRMNFDCLSKCYIQSKKTTQECCKLVKVCAPLLAQYKMLLWRKGRYFKIAELDPKKKSIHVIHPCTYKKNVVFDSVALDNEITEVGKLVITQQLILDLVKGMPERTAETISNALSKYLGRTFKEALDIHASIVA